MEPGMRITLKTLSGIVGAILLLLFVASIVQDLSASDERCDFCGTQMKYDYAQPSVNAVLVVYRCHECDQRGMREFRDDGTINWTEW